MSDGVYWASLTGKHFSRLLDYLANTPALVMAWIGTLAPLLASNLPWKQKRALVALSCLPACALWSSIHGKEAFIVLAMGMISWYWVELLENGRLRPRVIQVIGVLLLWVFKAPLAAAAGLITFILLLLRVKRLSPGIKYVIAFLALSCLSYGTVQFISEIHLNFEELHGHFAGGGASRDQIFWGGTHSIFMGALPGSVVSFMGPTFEEAVSRPAYLPFFIESVLLAWVLGLLLWKTARLKGARVGPVKISVYAVVLIFFLCHYPYGIFNPGAAIRYRTGFVFHMYFLVMLMIQYGRSVSVVGGSEGLGPTLTSWVPKRAMNQ